MKVEIKSEFDGGSTLNFNCNESDIQITDVIKLILSDSACFKSNTRKIFTKTTCLWLKNLPKLIPTNIVDKGEFVTFKSGKRMSKWYANSFGNSENALKPLTE